MESDKHGPEDGFPSVEEALKNVDLRLVEDDAPPLGRRAVSQDRLLLSAKNYAYPLDGGAEYRGWYKVTSGSDRGKSRWCPKWSHFGGRGGGHGGVDLYSHGRETLVAIADGKVQYNVADDPDGWGNHIYLYFKQDGVWYIACYAHVDGSSAFSGIKKESKGDTIGTAGSTGNAGDCWRSYKCTGKICVEDHLHIELFKMDSASSKQDPVAFFGWNVDYASDNSNTVCGKTVQQM